MSTETQPIGQTSDKPRKGWRPTLSTSILIGLVSGIATGIFFGELCAPLQVVGDGFIKLLQMTILPYIVVSLILGIGSLDARQARDMAIKAGQLLLLFWLISYIVILSIPLSFPVWESASFFSEAMIEPPREVDFLELYIPANPFYALANTIVPAVVLFCILLGVALIGMQEKITLLQTLSTLSQALIRITDLVVRLTPIGVFAIAAAAAAIANTPMGVSLTTRSVILIRACERVDRVFSRVILSCMPIRATPSRMQNRTTAGTMVFARE